MAQTTVPLSTPIEQPTRRALLGTLAAAGILGSGSAAAAASMSTAGKADPHSEWWRQSSMIRDRINAEDHADTVIVALMDKMYALDDLIAETHAQTLAGVCARPVSFADIPPGDRAQPDGREAAHLAFDHARAVLSTTALGRHCHDLDQDQLNHAAAPARGKTRHGRADAAGRCAPCGRKTACRGRSRRGGWRHG